MQQRTANSVGGEKNAPPARFTRISDTEVLKRSYTFLGDRNIYKYSVVRLLPCGTVIRGLPLFCMDPLPASSLSSHRPATLERRRRGT